MKNNKKIIKLIIFLCFITLFVFSFITIKSMKTVKAKEIKKEKSLVKKKTTTKKEKIKYYYVDIKGAVNNPGVYKLPKDSRVNDVINISGGIREDADTSIINLSKKIEDEMIIIIYTYDELNNYKKELKQMEEINKIKTEELVCPEKSNKACINNSETKESDTSNTSTKEEDSIININTATKEQLMTIKGIGEGKAESIIEYREKNGNFETIEDIKNVSGIGDSLYEKIKDYITV